MIEASHRRGGPSRQALARTFRLALLLTGCLTSELRAQAAKPEDASVWVNLRSGVYHCPGTEQYGKTRRGMYLTEAEARRRGYRARGGRDCGPMARPGAAPALPEGGPPPPDGYWAECVLERVVDADTIRCRGFAESVRLIGIDAPEQEQTPYGPVATAAVGALLPTGTTVHLELDRDPRDRRGRHLAYAWRDGILLNWVLVRQGWAVSLRIAPNLRYAEWLEEAERGAEGEAAGLWANGGFDCRPTAYRRGAC